MWNIGKKNFTAIPVDENAERREDFTPLEVLERAGCADPQRSLDALRAAGYLKDDNV